MDVVNAIGEELAIKDVDLRMTTGKKWTIISPHTSQRNFAHNEQHHQTPRARFLNSRFKINIVFRARSHEVEGELKNVRKMHFTYGDIDSLP